MIEQTDEMTAAFWLAHATAIEDDGFYTKDDAAIRLAAGLAAVLALVEREYVILPRGAQALCCRDHPDRPVRWGQCGECLAEMPPEERT